MRYTTIIDVTEWPVVWRNPNICRIYLWMTLKAGYHDDDRDHVNVSLRTIAGQCNLSLSAVRHALHILRNVGLVRTTDGKMYVTKFLIEQPITSRAKTKAQQQQQAVMEERERQHAALEKQLEAERRARNQDPQARDAALIKTYEEYAANPSTIVRRTFLETHKKRYEELMAKQKCTQP